jgi:RNA polymerase sigma-70 factor (ECF subfamily)
LPPNQRLDSDVYYPVTAIAASVLSIAPPAEAVPAWSREDPDVERLVRAAVAGDREAFGDLITRHERIVYRTALAALGRKEDAEDAAQEAFLIAWQKLAGFRHGATFRTWLLTIVWRKALDKRRSRGSLWKRQQAATEFDDIDPVDAVAATDPDPERRAVSSDLGRRVRVEIAGLSPKLRDALVLAASGEHSYADIGELLGIPVGTVKWRVSEARRILGARIES